MRKTTMTDTTLLLPLLSALLQRKRAHEHIVAQDFTTNSKIVERLIEDQNADGGDDLPEDVVGGLNRASRFSWGNGVNVLYWIGDAPAHGKWAHDISDDSYSHVTFEEEAAGVLSRLKEQNAHARSLLEVKRTVLVVSN